MSHCWNCMRPLHDEFNYCPNCGLPTSNERKSAMPEFELLKKAAEEGGFQMDYDGSILYVRRDGEYLTHLFNDAPDIAEDTTAMAQFFIDGFLMGMDWSERK